jgi:hypothetical protein
MKSTFAILSIMALGLVAPQPASAGPKARTVTVTIHRVKEINNLDKDIPRKDQADFFARVWIGGVATRTETLSKDDGYPNWTISAPVTTTKVRIKIAIHDDDGGLEEKDDKADICPAIGKKDLDLVYDTKSGRITGDVSGRRGRKIHARGGGTDSDKAQVWFTVK